MKDRSKTKRNKLLSHNFSFIRGGEDHSMVMGVLHWETAKPAIPDTDVALCAKRRSRSANTSHAPNLSGSEYTGAGPIGHMNTLDCTRKRRHLPLYTGLQISSVVCSKKQWLWLASHNNTTPTPLLLLSFFLLQMLSTWLSSRWLM